MPYNVASYENVLSLRSPVTKILCGEPFTDVCTTLDFLVVGHRAGAILASIKHCCKKIKASYIFISTNLQRFERTQGVLFQINSPPLMYNAMTGGEQARKMRVSARRKIYEIDGY